MASLLTVVVEKMLGNSSPIR